MAPRNTILTTEALPADKRRHYSNVTEALERVRMALLAAPVGDLVITVEHRPAK